MPGASQFQVKELVAALRNVDVVTVWSTQVLW